MLDRGFSSTSGDFKEQGNSQTIRSRKEDGMMYQTGQTPGVVRWCPSSKQMHVRRWRRGMRIATATLELGASDVRTNGDGVRDVLDLKAFWVCERMH